MGIGLGRRHWMVVPSLEQRVPQKMGGKLQSRLTAVQDGVARDVPVSHRENRDCSKIPTSVPCSQGISPMTASVGLVGLAEPWRGGVACRVVMDKKIDRAASPPVLPT